MLFNSFEFIFLFLPATLLVYWKIITKQEQRIWLLTLSSYAFYAFWDYRFTLLMFGCTMINYYCGARIARSDRIRHKKIWLFMALILSLSILSYLIDTTFLNKLQAGTLLKEISQEEGGEDKTKPVRKTTPWIQKDEINIPRVGSSEEFHLALFTLTENSPITQKIYKVGRSYFIGVLKERESPSEDKFNTDLEELRRQGAWSKQTQVFKYWLKNLRDNADIKFNTDLFPGLSDQAV